MSERMIGLTILAAGTSLPELATSLVAALRREADIALGNVVGSIVFNILAILGVASVVHPVEAHAFVLWLDLPVMVGAAMLVWVLCRTGGRLRRSEGAVLLFAYVAYVAAVFAAGVA
jgi:cation:H+ antiporter